MPGQAISAVSPTARRAPSAVGAQAVAARCRAVRRLSVALADRWQFSGIRLPQDA